MTSKEYTDSKGTANHHLRRRQLQERLHCAEQYRQCVLTRVQPQRNHLAKALPLDRHSALRKRRRKGPPGGGPLQSCSAKARPGNDPAASPELP